MINIAICDDNIYQLHTTQEFVNSHLSTKKIDYKIYIFDKLTSLEKHLAKTNFNILILEIRYNNDSRTGLAFTRQYASDTPGIKIIFLTSYTQYFQEAYLYNHIYYVLKEDMAFHLKNALDIALKDIDNTNPYLLSISFNRKHTIVNINDIVFMEKDLRKIKFFFKDVTKYLSPTDIKNIKNIKDYSLDTYASFDYYLPLLPDNFIQTHRAFIVNIDHIKEIHKNYVMMHNQKFVPISRKYHNEVDNRLSKYFIK